MISTFDGTGEKTTAPDNLREYMLLYF